MRIAMLGTRGIPAAYSGFETAVEHLAQRFSDRGHEVVVYCRPHMVEHAHRHAGARLVHLPTVRNKYLDTLAHTAVCTAHMLLHERPDVAVYFISGNAPVVPLAGAGGVPTVFQIDGLDSQRAKWPAPARAYLRFAERLAPEAATITVTDSEAVADAFEQSYGRRVPAIPYGAEVEDPGNAGWCAKLDVEPGRFVLFVGRLVPENNAHLLVEAHRASGCEWPLVIVGDAPYAQSYIDSLKRAAGPNVRFPGYVFGEGYGELIHRAGVMCAPTEVGGTHPVIVEALAAGAPLIVSDHPPNLETVGEAAEAFSLADGADGLARSLKSLIGDVRRRAELSRRATERAAERFSWDLCAERYLRLCELAISRSAGRSRPQPSTGSASASS
jgi:glycosyltransferase involved in cell wall biosynthesis